MIDGLLQDNTLCVTVTMSLTMRFQYARMLRLSKVKIIDTDQGDYDCIQYKQSVTMIWYSGNTYA